MYEKALWDKFVDYQDVEVRSILRKFAVMKMILNEMTMEQRNSKIYILLVVGMVAALGPFVTDFYLPAFPSLVTYFGASASEVQLSLTFSMIGLAVGQIFLGPVSDKFGRKRPLVISMFVFVLSSIACVVSPDIRIFVLARFIQGFSGAGGIVISKSIATDLYSGKDLAKFFSILACVQGLAPICAPVLGGLLLSVTNWRGIFGVLVVIGIILFLVLLRFRDSLPRGKRLQGDVKERFIYYKEILRHKGFMYFVLIQAFGMGVMFAYIASSPFIFQEHYDLSPLMYSLCFACNAIGIMLGSLSVIRFRSNENALQIGVWGFLVLSCFASVALCMELHIIVVEVIFFLFLFFLGIILPTSTTLALNLERQNSGTASAVLGFLTFLGGGIVSPLTGMGNILYSTSIIMIVCCVLILVCTWRVLKMTKV